ncbi:MAG: acyl carrier protein [Firmicutes bacterium]|nr:acyl carrier protein [Bacillota bacterium]
MNKSDIFEKVKDIIAENLSVDDPDRITPETSLTKDLEADSLYVVEVIMAIEDEFGIEIPDEDAEQFGSVEDIVDFVEENI